MSTQTQQHDRQDLVHQLSRIRGQIDGIATMMDEKRDCLDIVQQIMAARSSLARVGKEFLTTEAVQCSRSTRDKDKLDSLLKQLFTLE